MAASAAATELGKSAAQKGKVKDEENYRHMGMSVKEDLKFQGAYWQGQR
jgi:hypothetical protein